MNRVVFFISLLLCLSSCKSDNRGFTVRTLVDNKNSNDLSEYNTSTYKIVDTITKAIDVTEVENKTIQQEKDEIVIKKEEQEKKSKYKGDCKAIIDEARKLTNNLLLDIENEDLWAKLDQLTNDIYHAICCEKYKNHIKEFDNLMKKLEE